MFYPFPPNFFLFCLRDHLKRKCGSLTLAAQRLDVHYGSLSRALSGRRSMSRKLINKLELLLGVPIEDLYLSRKKRDCTRRSK